MSGSEPSPTTPPVARPWWRSTTAAAVGVVALVASLLGAELWLTAPVRGAVRSYTELIAAANRGDLERVRALCTDAYLATHPLRLAPEGGVIGLPRGIHPNFKAWAHGPHIWLCPTNRVGPVYQFARTPGGWKLDALAGHLRAGNQFVPADAAADPGPDG